MTAGVEGQPTKAPGAAKRRPGLGLSRQQILHHLDMYVRQAETAALVEVGQAFVINAQQAQHRGMEVVNVDANFTL
jgi:hypothetical protein